MTSIPPGEIIDPNLRNPVRRMPGPTSLLASTTS